MKPLFKRLRESKPEPGKRKARSVLRAMVATDRQKMIGPFIAHYETPLKQLRATILKAHPKCPDLFSFLNAAKEPLTQREEAKMKAGDIVGAHPHVGLIIFIQPHSRASSWQPAANAYLDFRDEDLSSIARIRLTRAMTTRGASVPPFSTTTLKPLGKRTSSDAGNPDATEEDRKKNKKKSKKLLHDDLESYLYSGAFRGEIPSALGPVAVRVQHAYRPGFVITVRSAESQRNSDAVYLSDHSLGLLMREYPHLLTADMRMQLAEHVVTMPGFLYFEDVPRQPNVFKLCVARRLQSQRLLLKGVHWNFTFSAEEGAVHVLGENSDSLHEETVEAYVPWNDAETIFGSKVDTESDLAEFGIRMSKAITVVGKEGDRAMRFSCTDTTPGSKPMVFSATRPIVYYDGAAHAFIVGIRQLVLEEGKSYRGSMKRMFVTLWRAEHRKRYELEITHKELSLLARRCGDLTLHERESGLVELCNRVVRRLFFLSSLTMKQLEFREDAALHQFKCFRTFYPYTLQITALLTLEYEVVILAVDQDGHKYQPLLLTLLNVAAALHRPKALLSERRRNRDFGRLVDMLAVDSTQSRTLQLLTIHQNNNRTAAIAIQRAAKGRLGRKKAKAARVDLNNKTAAATRIQTLSRKRAAQKVVTQKRQAIRDYQLREEHQAAQQLQRIARGRQARKRALLENTQTQKLMQAQNRAANMLQRLQRGNVARQQVKHIRDFEQQQADLAGSNKPRLQLTVHDTDQGILILAKDNNDGKTKDGSFFGMDVLRMLVKNKPELMARSKRKQLCGAILNSAAGIVTYVNTTTYNPKIYKIVLRRKFFTGRCEISDEMCFVQVEMVEGGLRFAVERKLTDPKAKKKFTVYLGSYDVYRFLFPDGQFPDSLARLSQKDIIKLVQEGFSFQHPDSQYTSLVVPQNPQSVRSRFGKMVFTDVLPVTMINKGAVPMLVQVFNAADVDNGPSCYFIKAEDPASQFQFEVDVEHDELRELAEMCGDLTLMSPRNEYELIQRLCKRLFLFSQGDKGDEQITLKLKWDAALSEYKNTFLYGNYAVLVTVIVTLEWEVVVLGEGPDGSNVGIIRLTLREAQKVLGGSRSFLAPKRMLLNSSKLCSFLDLNVKGELVLVSTSLKSRSKKATKVQTLIRGRQTRARVTKHKREKIQKEHAALQLQKSFRGFSGRKRAINRRQKMLNSASAELEAEDARGTHKVVPEKQRKFRPESQQLIADKKLKVDKQREEEAKAILRSQGLY